MDLDFRKDPSVLTAMVDSMADGVFTVDARGNFVAWSKGAERITGYSAEDVLGKPCRILEGANCKGFGTLDELLGDPSRETSILCDQECKVLAKRGHELYLHGNVRLLKDGQGTVLGAIGTFADLTSYVRANEKIAVLEEQSRSRDIFQQMVGKSAPMQELFRKLRMAAQSDVTVLVSGESGAGKELAVGAIHALSHRKDKPLLAVHCGAIPETLLESELFGHVKGAFTGAGRDKEGMFRVADGGTLFLDEIGDVSPLLQLKLLRALQEGEVRRVGDERADTVDVRLVAATNRNLGELVSAGKLREDFYYRIRVFEIRMPSLRERREDIPLLVEHFIAEFSRSFKRDVKGIARDALHRMLEYPWPGNVRELRNAIEHAFVTGSGDRIRLLDLPLEVRDPGATRRDGARRESSTDEERDERERIVTALHRSAGNQVRAAKALGVSRVTLWKKIKRLEIPIPGKEKNR